MIPAQAVEAAHPERSTCTECGGDGSPGHDCTCPGWIAVDDLTHADLKALLANDDISLGVPREKEL